MRLHEQVHPSLNEEPAAKERIISTEEPFSPYLANRLASFRNLAKGWADGDGEAISDRTYFIAVELLGLIQGSGMFPESDVAPTFSGGFTLEWGSPSVLVVTLLPTGDLKIVEVPPSLEGALSGSRKVRTLEGMSLDGNRRNAAHEILNELKRLLPEEKNSRPLPGSIGPAPPQPG